MKRKRGMNMNTLTIIILTGLILVIVVLCVILLINGYMNKKDEMGESVGKKMAEVGKGIGDDISKAGKEFGNNIGRTSIVSGPVIIYRIGGEGHPEIKVDVTKDKFVIGAGKNLDIDIPGVDGPIAVIKTYRTKNKERISELVCKSELNPLSKRVENGKYKKLIGPDYISENEQVYRLRNGNKELLKMWIKLPDYEGEYSASDFAREDMHKSEDNTISEKTKTYSISYKSQRHEDGSYEGSDSMMGCLGTVDMFD